MAIDPRLGQLDGSGAIIEIPTQYSDGSSASGDVLSAGTRVYINTSYFTILRPGTYELDEDTRSDLLGAVGSSGVIGSYSSILAELGLEPISNPYVFDDFEGDTLSSTKWDTDLSASATVTLPNNTGLTLAKVAVPATDDSHATLTSVLTFQSNADTLLVETRLRLSNTTELVVEFGVSDAASETNGIAFSSHDSTPVAVATNAVVFGYQNDSGGEANTTWNALRVKGGTAARTDTTIAPSTSFVELAIALAKNGSTVDASYLINGVQVAAASDVIANSIPLYAWVTVKAKSAAIRYAELDYLRASSTR